MDVPQEEIHTTWSLFDFGSDFPSQVPCFHLAQFLDL